MDAKERLYSAATQQFDQCVEKYVNKIKNCLWGMICHAYNEGRKDGIIEEKKKEREREREVSIGDVFVSFPRNELMVVTGFSGTEDALMLFQDGHTECYALEILEGECDCVRTEQKFDIREKFNEMRENHGA